MVMLLRILVILGLKKRNYPHLLARAWAIYNAFLAKPALFVTINVALLLTKIQALEAAQKAIATKTMGTIPARNLAAGVLITSLETARALVQELVDANPDHGTLIVESAAMLSSHLRVFSKAVLAATQAKPSGLVHLVANVGVLTADIKGKVLFNWEYSNDGGKSWLTATSTPHGTTNLAGLTPMVMYSFRTCVTDQNNTTPWSQVVTLLVR